MAEKIGVVGSTHLASVIAGCLSCKGFDVRVTDTSAGHLDRLRKGQLPIFEPQLENLIQNGIREGRLSFSSDLASQLKGVDFVYLAKDATKTEDGVDLEEIVRWIEGIADARSDSFTLIISTQVAVGTCDIIKGRINKGRKNPVHLAYVPEFLRLGNAVALFLDQDYTVIGCDSPEVFEACSRIFSNFTRNIFKMRLAEAEMSKHIANVFVATTVSFIAEMSKIAEHMGIDLLPVGNALRHDKRIGTKSYLLPGLGFSGGNLERDIKVLQKKLHEFGETSDFLDTVVRVNDHHNGIVFRRLSEIFGDFRGRKIAFLGITYKPMTNTLAGSLTLETGTKLKNNGACVFAFDPMTLSEQAAVFEGVEICRSIEDCIRGADATVAMIEKPEFKRLTPDYFSKLVRGKVILDAANMYDGTTFVEHGFRYCSIGRGFRW